MIGLISAKEKNLRNGMPELSLSSQWGQNIRRSKNPERKFSGNSIRVEQDRIILRSFRSPGA
jgi:hypothetical protein